ncbi:MAG: protein kinase [Lachnospiraceae bacterium]|nr:protein kinase [Lachnospiraceae bacterium]
MDINNLWSGYDLNSKKQNTRCLSVNTILEGKYLVGPVLGQGGFGITYVGYDLNMETKIAIKEYFPVELVSRDTTTMHGDRVLSLGGEKSVTYQQGLKKYVAEAQNVSQFSEVPGVVSVKDFFYANETAYIVMEFIDGISLKDYLKECGGRLSEEETLKIMKPVLEALVQVHKAGIIHRDISPDNIMLTFEEETGGAGVSGTGSNAAGDCKIQSVKLIDFGAARMTAKNDQKSLTIILKHGYAPEEQYRTHGEQGPWTDVYALCAVFYRMLTGEIPVPAMDRLFQDDLKTLEQCGAKVSANTSAAILKGLAVKKDDRIRSVQELIAALYKGAKVRTAGKKTNKVPFFAGAGVVAIAACVLAVSFIGHGNKQNTDTASGSGSVTVQETAAENSREELAPTESTEIKEAETVAIAEQEEERIGEAIVKALPQNAIAGGSEHVVVRKPDGTVEAFGGNEYGQLNVQDWTHIAAVEAGEGFSAGLREDGKVFIAGSLDSSDEVEAWENIVAIAADGQILVGLKDDGTLVSSDLYGKTGDYYEWTDIRSVACSNWALAALDEDGTVHLSACNDDSGGYVKELAEITGWTDVEQLVCSQFAVFGLTTDGDVRYASMFTDATEGSEYDFANMESFNNIVQLYSNAGLTQIGVREDGSLCVGGVVHEINWQMEVFEWKDLAGFMGLSYDEKYVGLKKDGTIIKTIKNYGTSTPEEMKNLKWVDVDSDGNLLGLTKDGKPLTYGSDINLGAGFSDISTQSGLKQIANPDGMADFVYLNENGKAYVSEPAFFPFRWENITQIEVLHWAYCFGLTTEGTIEAQDFSEETYGYPEEWNALKDWTEIKQIAVGGYEVYGLKQDGTVIWCCEGGETIERNDWKNIHAIFSGSDGVVAIKEDGTAEFSNDWENDYGQKNIASWDKLTQVASGQYHTVGLREDGTVAAAGNNQSGQCDVEDWSDIVYIAVGDNCTLGVTSDGNLMVAGNVGW